MREGMVFSALHVPISRGSSDSDLIGSLECNILGKSSFSLLFNLNGLSPSLINIRLPKYCKLVRTAECLLMDDSVHHLFSAASCASLEA